MNDQRRSCASGQCGRHREWFGGIHNKHDELAEIVRAARGSAYLIRFQTITTFPPPVRLKLSNLISSPVNVTARLAPSPVT